MSEDIQPSVIPASPPVTVGHPVDVATGAVFTAWHDFEFLGRVPIVWRRFYSTANAELTALGHGWTCEYLRRLEERDGRVIMYGPEGHEHGFDAPGAQSSEIAGHHWELRAQDAGTYALRDRLRGTRHVFVRRAHGSAQFALLRIEDQSGNALALAYDPAGRLSSIQQTGLNRAFIFTYSTANLVARIDFIAPGIAPEPLVVYAHDAAGNLISSTDARGGTIRYEYDAHHRLIRETNKVGGSFGFEYDALGRCVRSWGDGNYMERRLEYDVEHRRTRVTDSLGATTTYHLDTRGVVEKVVDPLGYARQHLRGPTAEQLVDPFGAVLQRTYDERGQLIARTDWLGREFVFTYDDRGLETSVTSPDGAVMRRTYDDLGRLAAVTDPLGGLWRLDRDERGTITAQVDPEGRRVTRRWDPALRWQEIADPIGHYRCEYDAKGRPVLTSDRQGLLRIFETDVVNGITAERTVDNARIAFDFNAAGNLVGARHLNGTYWRFEYDQFGHMTGAENPVGDRLAVTFDTEGRRRLLVNKRGERFEESHDARGDVVQRRYFDGREEHYERDAAWRVTAVHRADGSTLHRKYDAAGQITEETIQEPRAAGEPPAAPKVIATYEYDWMGHVVRAVNESSTIEFVYDAGGRLIAERQNDFELRYEYDRAGLLVQRELVGGTVGPVRFSYNAARMMEEVLDSGGVVERYAYDSAHQLSRRWMRAGWVEKFGYDARRRVVDQQVEPEHGGTSVKRRYDYDVVDNLIRVSDSGRGSTRYQYDETLRLISAIDDKGHRDRFEYEPGDNLTQQNARPFTYDMGSRLRRAGATTFEYDLNGLVVSRSEGGLTTRYEYDAKQRLRAVISADGVRHEYDYDALGRRIAKRSPGREVRFVWSRTHLAAIIPSDGPAVELIVDSARHVPVMQWVGSVAEHFVGNHLGAPTESIRPDSGIVWSADYAPFGAARVRGVNDESGRNCRLPGQYEDSETGLHYNYGRFYDPTIARYLTPDPIGIEGGLNLYDYPRDPINWIDPSGFKCPNPKLVKSDPKNGIEIHQHDDGSMTITADCRQGFATPKPNGLRDSIQTGDLNRDNPPEAHLGQDGRLIVMEGTHRAAAASTGQQIPPDPDNPHLGGVPGKPGFMTFEYYKSGDDDQPGVPLQSLTPPPNYPHKW